MNKLFCRILNVLPSKSYKNPTKFLQKSYKKVISYRNIVLHIFTEYAILTCVLPNSEFLTVKLMSRIRMFQLVVSTYHCCFDKLIAKRSINGLKVDAKIHNKDRTWKTLVMKIDNRTFICCAKKLYEILSYKCIKGNWEI